MHIINLIGELSTNLHDIILAQQAGARTLDENRKGRHPKNYSMVDISPQMVERYFQYYFFNRRDEMDYPLSPRTKLKSGKLLGRNDTLLRMLSENELSVGYAKKPLSINLTQSFGSASDAFYVIEKSKHGIIIPNAPPAKDGMLAKDLIEKLRDIPEDDNIFAILRDMQQFTVAIFPWEREKLDAQNALEEIKDGTGVYCLKQDVQDLFYSGDFGLMVG